jgi:hypothetical protein
MANSLPVVTFLMSSNVLATHGQSLAASSLFTASDVDGDQIAQYALWDSNGNGYWVVNGVKQGANVEIDVPASQLGLVFYQSGSGADLLYARANDGTGWGAWQSFLVSAPIDAGAVVQPLAASQSAQHGQVYTASQLFTASDSDNDTIIQYDFWDTGSGGRRWLLNGNALGTGQDNYVSAAELSQITYRSGTGTDTLYVRAFDGFVWGAWSGFSVIAPPDAGPTVTASNATLAKGASIAASSLFSATAPRQPTRTMPAPRSRSSRSTSCR